MHRPAMPPYQTRTTPVQPDNADIHAFFTFHAGLPALATNIDIVTEPLPTTIAYNDLAEDAICSICYEGYMNPEAAEFEPRRLPHFRDWLHYRPPLLVANQAQPYAAPTHPCTHHNCNAGQGSYDARPILTIPRLVRAHSPLTDGNLDPRPAVVSPSASRAHAIADPWNSYRARDGPLPTKLRCGHVFHRKCIASWWAFLDQKDGNDNAAVQMRTCPYCRRIVGTDGQTTKALDFERKIRSLEAPHAQTYHFRARDWYSALKWMIKNIAPLHRPLSMQDGSPTTSFSDLKTAALMIGSFTTGGYANMEMSMFLRRGLDVRVVGVAHKEFVRALEMIHRGFEGQTLEIWESMLYRIFLLMTAATSAETSAQGLRVRE